MAFERNHSDRSGLETPISSRVSVREEDSLARHLQLTGISSPRPDLGPPPAFTPCFKQSASTRPRLVVLRKT